MAMQPAIAHQNGRGVWLYNSPPATASQISSKEATKRAVHRMARNTVLIPISQGNKVTKVTEYIPFRYFTRTVKYGNQFNHAMLWRGTTRNQDSRGIRPRWVNRVHQAQGEPWWSPVAWVSTRKWYLASIQLWTDQAKRGLNNAGQVKPKILLFKQKGQKGHLCCKTLQIWMARSSQPPHKFLKWTPRWTMPKTRRCLPVGQAGALGQLALV